MNQFKALCFGILLLASFAISNTAPVSANTEVENQVMVDECLAIFDAGDYVTENLPPFCQSMLSIPPFKCIQVVGIRTACDALLDEEVSATIPTPAVGIIEPVVIERDIIVAEPVMVSPKVTG